MVLSKKKGLVKQNRLTTTTGSQNWRVRRWQKFGFAGQFSPLIPVIQPGWQQVPAPPDLAEGRFYPPVYFQMPHKADTYSNLNWSLGAGLGDSWAVYATYWQFDFPNWIAPDGACLAQHLPVGAVMFPQVQPWRLFDALFNGFPLYPPLGGFGTFTSPLFKLSFERPVSIES